MSSNPRAVGHSRTQLRWFRDPPLGVSPGGIMGIATCGGTPGFGKHVLEGIKRRSGPGNTGDPTVGGRFPAEAYLLCAVTLNSTSGRQMEMCINGFPELHSDFSIYFSMSSSTSKCKQYTNCTHFQFFYPPHPTQTHTHTHSHKQPWYLLQIDYRSVQRI